ncbi:MAG: hypothetical protein R6U04_09150 [Bacteroidales bacterium]
MRFSIKILVLPLISFFLLTFSSCIFQKTLNKEERSAKVNNSIEEKTAKERAEEREKFRERHYERQAPSTKKQMDHNARMAKEWREKNLSTEKPNLWHRITTWIKKQYRKIKPRDKGLFK